MSLRLHQLELSTGTRTRLVERNEFVTLGKRHTAHMRAKFTSGLEKLGVTNLTVLLNCAWGGSAVLQSSKEVFLGAQQKIM